MSPDGQNILVVVDDRARRERLAAMLAEEGFAVTAAAEGLAALRAAARQPFAMALAAARLPGSLDGPTTVRRLRARQPRLKALYIDEAAMRPLRRDPEIEDGIVAPFERRELIGCVFELLHRGSPADLAQRARTGPGPS
ncbi:MAG: response regulator [Alphaproteobacteria bacterium]|nr:response regulator [Alphaproteobacteria bacterium]MBV9554784.1 response regulator [Alphaproteobacteria bacterium]